MHFPHSLLSPALATCLCALSASGQAVSYQAVFQIDSKTELLPGLTPIIEGDGWENVSTGDRYIVNFTIDTSVPDTNDNVENNDNVILTGDVREGTFQGPLTALSIRAASGNTGTYDPNGTSFNTNTPAPTIDAVGVYKSNGTLANNEAIQFLSSVSQPPPELQILGGDLTDLFLNFRSLKSVNTPNSLDVLDDRSTTNDPFSFGSLFGGSSSVFGDARDLVLLTDDINDANGFSVGNIDRPLSLRFGEVTYFESLSDTHDLYAWGTFESLVVVPEPSMSLLVVAIGAFTLTRRKPKLR